MNQIIRIIAVLVAALGWCGATQAQTVFTEVAEGAGVADSESNAISSSPYWGDFDNDGWLDVYVTYFGELVTGRVTPEGFSVADTILAVPPRLYRNNRDGTFTDVAARAGVDTAIAGSASWGDFDKDGDLDLLVTGGTPGGATRSR